MGWFPRGYQLQGYDFPRYWLGSEAALAGVLLEPGYWPEHFFVRSYQQPLYWPRYGVSGELLPPGYWHTTDWPRSYWSTRYWPAWGAAVPVAPDLEPEHGGGRRRRRRLGKERARIHRDDRELFEILTLFYGGGGHA